MAKKDDGVDEAKVRSLIARQQTVTAPIEPMIKDLFEKLRATFPGQTDKELVERHILPAVMDIPPWDERGFQVGRGAVFNSGAFCIYYGDDPDTGKLVALLHIRKETKPSGAHLLGAVGGYTKEPEQPIQGLAREFGEEICDDNKQPIIKPDRARYCIINAGKDFSQEKGKLPIEYTSYAYELSAEEIRALKAHAQKLASDRKYKEECKKNSQGETFGIRVLPLEDIVKMSPADFRYHRHYDTYREVASRLGLKIEGLVQGRVPTRVGYPAGGNVEQDITRYAQDETEWVRFAPTGRSIIDRDNAPGGDDGKGPKR